MKITLYVRPDANVSSYARSIKSLIEEETGQLCIVKVSESKFKPVKVKEES